MAYIIGQYNHNSASQDDRDFITAIQSGIVKRRKNSGDMGVIGSSLDPFEDECIQLSSLNFEPSKYYYFRGQIKRMTEAQTFTIKLVNYDDIAVDSIEQFVKQIVVQGGDREEWVSVEFIFRPVVSFDTILFQLQRTINDYRVFSRYPKIAYQQLGVVNNMIERKIGPDISLLKMGVQSHPGLTLCVNGEEIHLSRSGIFEVRNGVIPVNFFSVTNPAIENNQNPSDINSVEGWKNNVNQQIEDIENNPSLTTEQKEAAYAAINSKCFFGTSKTYKIDAFILDYMYSNT